MPRSITHSVAAATTLVLLAGASLAACDDDDAGDDESAALPEELCDAYVDLSRSFFEGPPAMIAAADTIAAAAPADLADDAAAVQAGMAAIETDEGALESPEFRAGLEAVGDAVFERCPTETAVDVAGVDFAFTGLPTELPAGRVALRIVNESESGEPHELLLVRRLPGTDAPVLELLEVPEDELFSLIEMVSVAFVDEPGASMTSLVDLEPGGYIAVCVIPTAGDETDPHAAHGMAVEIDVT